MLEKLVAELYREFKMGEIPAEDEKKRRTVMLGGFAISIRETDPGLFFSASIAPLPTVKKEEFLTLVMKANFLGQGSGGATIGLEEDESSLTLSCAFLYDMNYHAFKDALEKFTNFLQFWKTEVARFT